MKKLIFIAVLAISFLLPTISTISQTNYLMESLLKSEKRILELKNSKSSNNSLLGQKKFYNPAKWKQDLDLYWGEGLSTEKKLELFNKYWDSVRINYDCFVNLPTRNWDSVISSLRTEISQGVSRGKFAAIMTKLMKHLNDGHTIFIDVQVKYADIKPGIPILNEDSKNTFPACVSPINDEQVVVYDAVPNNPFNLVRGDEILGYNNKLLSELYTELDSLELPEYMVFGSTPSAYKHKRLNMIACSWHLFDTIDIKKINGSIEHYSTRLLDGNYYYNQCYDMIPPEGIKLPTISEIQQRKNTVSTILPGTNIGYVALFDCMDLSGDTLVKHIKNLVENQNCKGLIIDLRMNMGGSILTYDKAYTYLADDHAFNWTSIALRENPNDYWEMTVHPEWAQGYNIFDSDPHFYEFPIAMLVGPNAISAGDIMPLLYKHLPNLKMFGEPTAGAFGSISGIELNFDGYFGTYQDGTFYEPAYPDVFLSHLEHRVDFPMWFTKESLAAGKDNVREKACAWINGTLSVDDNSNTNKINIFPNPAKSFIKISNGSSDSRIEIINSLGQLILNIDNYKMDDLINIESLNSGIYVMNIYTNSKLSGTSQFIVNR